MDFCHGIQNFPSNTDLLSIQFRTLFWTGDSSPKDKEIAESYHEYRYWLKIWSPEPQDDKMVGCKVVITTENQQFLPALPWLLISSYLISMIIFSQSVHRWSLNTLEEILGFITQIQLEFQGGRRQGDIRSWLIAPGQGPCLWCFCFIWRKEACRLQSNSLIVCLFKIFSRGSYPQVGHQRWTLEVPHTWVFGTEQGVQPSQAQGFYQGL